MVNQNDPNKITSVRTLIIDGNGRFALARRKAGTEQAGLWEFPGGKVDVGEKPIEAAVREPKEEIGLEVRLLSPLEAFESRVIPDGKHAGKPYQALGCFALSNSPTELQALDGVDAVGWFTAEEIRHMDVTPTTRNATDRLL